MDRTGYNLGSPVRSQGIRDLNLKFLIIGDYGVGKTAVIRRYTRGYFASNYKITIGADFYTKTLMLDERTRVSLHLWDIAGHERFCHMTRVFYKYAIGCIVIFDVTRHSSFKSVSRWIADLNNKVILDDGAPLPVVLFANKSDTIESCVSDEAIKELCRDLGIRHWFKTSAKNNVNIDEGVDKLIEEAIDLTQPDDTQGMQKSQRLVLTDSVDPQNQKCCS